MDIPIGLKLFKWIYEARLWLLAPLWLGWLAVAVLFLRRGLRRYFAWLLVMPLFIQPLHVGAVWCGWHYRMRLYERYAALPEQVGYNINRMPPHARDEYARRDYHPRFREVKAAMAWTILSAPLVLLAGCSAWMLCARRTKRRD